MSAAEFTAVLTSGGDVPPREQLWSSYKLLEYSRRTLPAYDKQAPYKVHSSFESIQELMSADPNAGMR